MSLRYKHVWWPQYTAVQLGGGSYVIDLYKYHMDRKTGIKNYVNYLKCKYIHKCCDFSEGVPTYFRPKVCKRCGSLWRFTKGIFPPLYHKCTRWECPHCLEPIDISKGAQQATCWSCKKEVLAKDVFWVEKGHEG